MQETWRLLRAKVVRANGSEFKNVIMKYTLSTGCTWPDRLGVRNFCTMRFIQEQTIERTLVRGS